MRPISTSLVAFIALVVLASVTCGGGGGGGGGGGPTAPPGINFTPSGPPIANSLYLQEGGGTNASRLFLQVRVEGVDDFYGVAFDLIYPSGILNYATVTEGGFLTGQTSLLVEDVGGRLIVGHTRLGNVSGRSGSGLLMTLEFTPVGSGSGSFTFANEQAYRTNSFSQFVNFIAGSVTVSP